MLQLISAPGSSEHPDQELLLDPSCGGRAVSWQVDGLELLGRRDDHPVEFGMYPMVPWAGRLRGNRITTMPDSAALILPATYDGWALHGTVLAETTQVLQCTSSQAVLACALPDPFTGHVQLTWQLEPGLLRTRIEVRAERGAFPAVVGWHPWFRRTLARGGRGQWQLPEGRIAPRDDERMPTAAFRPATMADGPFDDAFISPGPAVIRWPDALTMQVHNSAPWFVIFDELDDFLLVEPQSGPPNGSNEPLTGAIPMVQPGRPLVHDVSWGLRRERPEGQV